MLKCFQVKGRILLTWAAFVTSSMATNAGFGRFGRSLSLGTPQRHDPYWGTVVWMSPVGKILELNALYDIIFLLSSYFFAKKLYFIMKSCLKDAFARKNCETFFSL